jgi:hypothetical protein
MIHPGEDTSPDKAKFIRFDCSQETIREPLPIEKLAARSANELTKLRTTLVKETIDGD